MRTIFQSTYRKSYTHFCRNFVCVILYTISNVLAIGTRKEVQVEMVSTFESCQSCASKSYTWPHNLFYMWTVPSLPRIMPLTSQSHQNQISVHSQFHSSPSLFTFHCILSLNVIKLILLYLLILPYSKSFAIIVLSWTLVPSGLFSCLQPIIKQASA